MSWGGSRPGSGRPRGSRNKDTQLVVDALADNNHDPIVALVNVAKDQNMPVELRTKINLELAQYIAPKRKSVEIDAVVSGQLGVAVMSFKDVTPDQLPTALNKKSVAELSGQTIEGEAEEIE